MNSTATPAVIDHLATEAVTASSDPSSPESAQAWGALWRVVLDLDRWFFVKDGSGDGAVRPGLVQLDGKTVLPAFTDITRAIAFAEAGRGGANAVFASPPRDMLSAAQQLADSGIDLVVFNVDSRPFAAPPLLARSFLDDLDTLSATAAPAPVGQEDPDAPTIIDHLAASAASQPDVQSARSALWQAAFHLPHWFFVPRGEQLTPLAVRHETGPAMVAFTSAGRAAQYAATFEPDESSHDAGSVVAVPVSSVVGYLEQFAATGIVLVRVDPGHGAFDAAPGELRELYTRAVGTAPAGGSPA